MVPQVPLCTKSCKSRYDPPWISNPPANKHEPANSEMFQNMRSLGVAAVWLATVVTNINLVCRFQPRTIYILYTYEFPVPSCHRPSDTTAKMTRAAPSLEAMVRLCLQPPQRCFQVARWSTRRCASPFLRPSIRSAAVKCPDWSFCACLAFASQQVEVTEHPDGMNTKKGTVRKPK